MDKNRYPDKLCDFLHLSYQITETYMYVSKLSGIFIFIKLKSLNIHCYQKDCKVNIIYHAHKS